MPIKIHNDPSVPALPEASQPPSQPGAPADPAPPAVADEKKPKAKRTRGPSKRKAAAAAKDAEAPALPLPSAPPMGDDGDTVLPLVDDEEPLAPLPEDATGFRKRAKADDYKPVQSSSIPQLSVGEVRKCLNQIRKAGEKIRSEHLLWNGWPAGKFALAFLMGNHIKRKARKGDKESDGNEEGEAEVEGEGADEEDAAEA